MQRNRNVYIDIVKSVAIFMVVLGHSLQFTLPDNERFSSLLFIMIYSMHMPLFVSISGYLFYYQTQKYSCKELIKNKLRTIGLPALSFSILIVLAQLIIIWLKGNLSFDSSINCVGNYFLKGVWFLWALLIISVIYCCLIKLDLSKTVLGTMLMIPFSFFVPNVSIANWCIYLMPFFGIGYIFNRLDISHRIHQNQYFLFVLSCFIWFCTLPLMLNKEALIYNSGTYIFVSDMDSQVMRNLTRFTSGFTGSCAILLLINMIVSINQHFVLGGGKFENIYKSFLNTMLFLGRSTLHIYAISMCLVNALICTIVERFVSCYPISITIDVTVVTSICVLGSKIISQHKITRFLFSGIPYKKE